MKILVTGGTGFVGSAVVRRLLHAGHEIRALVRPDSDRRNLDGFDVEPAIGDLNDPSSLTGVCAGCEALFHVAADYRLWTRDGAKMIDTNVGAVRNIMEAAMAADVSRIVYTSSVATLGIPTNGVPGDEETPVSFDDMIGFYKQSKFRAEQEVRKFISEHKLPVVIVNPSTPIGPRDIKPTPTGQMVVRAAAGKMPAFVDTGLNIVHVDDVADGHLLAFEKGKIGERYVLGGEDMNLRDILGAITKIAGIAAPKFRLPHGAVLPIAYLAQAWAYVTDGKEPFATVDGIRMAKKHMFFSSEKAKRDLGYQSRPAQDAFADAVDWFRANGYLK
ncbi:MAG: NAD-dependent epimerase/dehydratase family protein [Rhodospirillales bacterium]|jgi:dihydroflavonol-4-reductase|nr:NAD-dependent epimerase/dehydratase family protein [Rhodospirillales bacterium]